MNIFVFTKLSINKEFHNNSNKFKVSELSHGVIKAVTMVVSFKIISMEKESTNGQMEDSLMETGKKTKWTEKEFSHGLMEDS